MKKLLLFLSLIALFSCEKHGCKACVTTFYMTAESPGIVVGRFLDCNTSDIDTIKFVPKYPMYYTVCSYK